jgi:beta-glucanase (GH16 family)
MLGNNIHQVGWPTCGEIDIMETIGKDPSHNHGTLHAKNFDKGASYYLKEGFSTDYHTFAANWQPDRIEFYTDGHLYQTIHKSEAGGNWPFIQKFYILINLAVGG